DPWVGRSEALVTLDGYFPFAPPEGHKAWAERRAVVQRRVLVAAGLWPVARMVEPRMVRWGAIEREGYRVERVYFESLPGFHVTGSLYVPTAGEGPYPGVLSPHGHWASGRFSTISDTEATGQMERGEEQYLANAKFHLQARCAQLARMGCVVLHYDMIGYADSRQIEHHSGFGDVQAELWTLGAFGLQTRNSLQALGVLQGLPEVDSARIAVTGGSGGGTQTFILGAVDDRPSVLFPAVMASTAMQGGCVCENASHLRVDTGNIELAAMAAPRPLGLTGADDWTKEILTKGLPELRALYSMLGHEEDVQAWCYPSFPHNYNAISRGHLYAFLNEHLGLGQSLPIVEPPLVPIAVEQLSVYDENHVRPSGGIAGVRAAMQTLASEDLQRFAKLAANDPDAYRRIVGGALEVMLHVPAGAGPKSASAVDVLSAGALSPGMREALGSEVSIEQHEPFDGSLRTNHRNGQVLYTWGYNPTHLAYRVHDLRARLANMPVGARPALLGQGDQARAALLAAALDPQSVSRIAVEFSAGFDAISEHADPDFLPGAERWGGLAGYAALIAPTPLTLLGVEQVPEVVRAAYEAAGVPYAVRAVGDLAPEELASWLLSSAR
ncbi:MAG: dienelactone hydrolase, partial [Planctomycetota bacterium]